MDKTALNRPDFRQIALLGSTLLLAAVALASGPARSQALDPNDLEELVAPIALYPDDLLGIILPASTFPLDIVRAARFLDDLEQDPTLEPDQAWDESVIALLNYPEILRLMNEDIDWTWALGEAVLTDETAVLAAAQDFRRRAMLAGNLSSDDRQTVADDGDVIEITRADPEIVYVPIYEPAEVVVYQPRPVYRYYPVAYPVYYYPYPSGYFWPSSFFWGVTSYFSIGWHTHHLHLYHHSHRLHPYYLNTHYLYRPYYYRSNAVITVSANNYSNVWLPRPRRGDRPRTLTIEGRESAVRSTRTATVESQPNISTTRGAATSTRAAAGGLGRQGTRATTTTTAIAGTTRRGAAPSVSAAGATRSQSTSERRGEPAIGGRVERSATATEGSAPSRTRPVPTTTTTPSQLRGVSPSRAAPPTRAPTPAPSTSTRSTTRSSGAAIGGMRRSTPAPTPATRAASAQRAASAPAPARTSGLGRVGRAAPAPTPAPRAAPAPTRSSGLGGVRSSAPTPRAAPAPSPRGATRSSSSSSAPQGTRRSR